MASHDDRRIRRAPLADWATRFQQLSKAGAIELRELPFAAQLNLRIDSRSERFSCIADALGFELPREPNTARERSGQAGLWLGPDEWLLVGEQRCESLLLERVRQTLAGSHYSVVDVTANRTVIELAGERARDVLASGCMIDLHPRAFGPGQCVQTLCSRAQVVLWQIDERPSFRLFVRPSFGPYLAEWLLDAAAEYGSGATRVAE